MNHLQSFAIGASNRKAFLCAFVLFFLSISSSLFAEVIYVKPHGIGKGISWNKAAGDLAAVLRKAKPGTEIWVAEGTYTPTKTKNRNVSFEIPDGVKIYGGFKGNEIFRKDRNPIVYLTVLSGEIGSTSLEDNSYNVIYTKNVSNETVIDGFHIINGCAQTWKASQGHRSRSGAAWYNDGSFGASNPQITNCFFSNNRAIDGGAIYNNGMNGKCEVTLTGCSFINNFANSDGGAIYNSCHEEGAVFTYFSSCKFEGNESNNGAGIFNYNVTGMDEVKLLNCSFVKNTAFARGSAIFDHSFDATLVDLKDCVFEANKSTLCRKEVYSSLFKEPEPAQKKKERVYRL